MRLEHWFYHNSPAVSLTLPPEPGGTGNWKKNFSFHLAQRIETRNGDGQDAGGGPLAALLAMEGMEQRKEECRDRAGSTGWKTCAGRTLRVADSD